MARAKALREAQEIRAYVSAVRDRRPRSTTRSVKRDFKTGRSGDQSAGRIDPVLSGSFRTVQVDD